MGIIMLRIRTRLEGCPAHNGAYVPLMSLDGILHGSFETMNPNYDKYTENQSNLCTNRYSVLSIALYALPSLTLLCFLSLDA